MHYRWLMDFSTGLLLHVVKWFYVLSISDGIMLEHAPLSRWYSVWRYRFFVISSISRVYLNSCYYLGNIWVCHFREFVISCHYWGYFGTPPLLGQCTDMCHFRKFCCFFPLSGIISNMCQYSEICYILLLLGILLNMCKYNNFVISCHCREYFGSTPSV